MKLLLTSLGLGVACVALCLSACSDDEPGASSTSSSSSSSSSGGGDGGASSSSGSVDGGNSSLGEPIEATAGAWTWVPFADSSCANGSPTGIGINKGTSKRLVIFLEGGGACWSKTTCSNSALVANIPDGFGKEKFDAYVDATPGGLFDRTVAENPYKDASFVYVPYCTGDIHSGDKEQQYEDRNIKHFGRRNIAAYLKRVVPTFTDLERVTLTGSSAGGFGAAVNYERFAKAFAPVRVDLVDDSGPPFTPDRMPLLATWSAAWDLWGDFDAACTGCTTDVSKIMPYYLTKYPSARFALLSYDTDQTIRTFYTLPIPMPANDFKTTLNAVTASNFDGTANGRYFLLPGSLHTMLRKVTKKNTEGALEVVGAGNVTLASWLTAMDTDATTWASVKVEAANP